MDGNFRAFFDRLLMHATASALERDVLRNTKSVLKAEYKRVLDNADHEIDKINAAVKTRNYTGTICSVCGTPQFESPSGDTCENGHGGAPPVEEGEER